jgi:hypothetical protein
MTFARPSLEEIRERNEARRAANMRALVASPSQGRGSYVACGERAEPIPKENAVRSEAYRRLVAALPCKNCGRVGRSQAAHPPPEGKSLKHDDRKCFPLCCDELGRKGCHPRYDQYELFPHDVALRWAAHWGEETRVQITKAGLWPLGLEPFE